MAVIRPFHAIRYHEQLFPELADVLAPPYDIINATEQEALYQRSPENVIRLEFGRVNSTDSLEDNRYTRARATLDSWLAQQTLILDDVPAFYPHRQRFSWEGQSFVRSGFFAAVELQPFDQGDVLPHEWTLKGPKEDRLKLMAQCQASFSPVFGLYDGQNTEVGAVLTEVMRQNPLARAEGNGFHDELWRMQDSEITRRISEALSKRQILIADGHHRYETTLAVRNLLRQQFPDAPATAAFNYAFMLLVDINDPGLLVLPTHRLLLLTPEMTSGFCRIASEFFRMEQIAIADPAQVTGILAARQDEHAFVWYAQGMYTLLTSPKTSVNGLPVLDVVALQERLISPLLMFDATGEASVEQNVRYTVSPSVAVDRVGCGEAAAALFLNHTPVEDVLTLAANGIRLPQKSTYFYPKVPTGLVMHSLQPTVTVG